MTSTPATPITISDAAPRKLTLRAARKRWNEVQSQKDQKSAFQVLDLDGKVAAKKSDLEPGYEQLHSFYAPGLTADTAQPTQTIQVEQIISLVEGAKAGDPNSLELRSEQTFEVQAPQFNIPDGDIHSVYPAQGMGAEANILPHVVFNDAHLPWERQILDPTKEKNSDRNRVPWLALLCFTADELTLSADELSADPKTGLFDKSVTQSSTLGLELQISDIQKAATSKGVVSCIPADSASSTTANFILMKPQQFTENFTLPLKDEDGNAVKQTAPDVQKFKYLAHSKAINTVGIADTGDVEENSVYSVVVACRAGRWDIKNPVPIYVHLVSIDQVNTMPWPPPSTGYIALCSLYSWTYNCLPPLSLDVADAFQKVGKAKAYLGPTEDVYKPMTDSSDPIKQLVGQRLKDGFTMTKYRVQTGEETVAFYRSPFTPTAVPHPLNANLQQQSTFSTDLQILDRTLGIMDITYSVAWQLGRTLGLGDQSFFTALGRLRSTIHDAASKRAKESPSTGTKQTPVQKASSLIQSLDALGKLATNTKAVLSAKQKWNKTNSTRVAANDLSLWDDEISQQFEDSVNEVAMQMAMSTDKLNFYNEVNAPLSSDWEIVLKWVLDRMFLFGIPAHYLIPDPSFLPQESLRVFQIDQNWVDALIDGALSLANHVDQDNDVIRSGIKNAINAYLNKIDPVLEFKPQLPIFGLYLRTTLVSQFPDLQVSVNFKTKDSHTAPILRHEIVSAGTMLVLLDHLPHDGDLLALTFTQPPHQQRFAAAEHIGLDPRAKAGTTPNNIFKVIHKSIFTTDNGITDEMRESHCGPDKVWTEGGKDDSPVFDFGSRMVYISNFAHYIFNNLIAQQKDLTTKTFTDTLPTAAMMALQLNDPVYVMEVDLNDPKPETKTTPPTVSAKSTTSLQVLAMTSPRDRSDVKGQYAQWKQSQSDPATTPDPTEAISPAAFSNLSLPEKAATNTLPPPPHYVSIRTVKPDNPASSPPPGSPKLPSGDGEPPAKPTPTQNSDSDSNESSDSDSNLDSDFDSSTASGPANIPKFLFNIFPISGIKPGQAPSPRITVPMQPNFKQDLVFSIHLPLSQRRFETFSLTELNISIPYGPASCLYGYNNLFTTYQGNGPVMLSNLRFNAIAENHSNSTGQTFLRLRIMPRKMTGGVSVKTISDLSILLPEVQVIDYGKSGQSVTCFIHQLYSGQINPYKTTLNINLEPFNNSK